MMMYFTAAVCHNVKLSCSKNWSSTMFNKWSFGLQADGPNTYPNLSQYWFLSWSSISSLFFFWSSILMRHFQKDKEKRELETLDYQRWISPVIHTLPILKGPLNSLKNCVKVISTWARRDFTRDMIYNIQYRSTTQNTTECHNTWSSIFLDVFYDIVFGMLFLLFFHNIIFCILHCHIVCGLQHSNIA